MDIEGSAKELEAEIADSVEFSDPAVWGGDAQQLEGDFQEIEGDLK